MSIEKNTRIFFLYKNYLSKINNFSFFMKLLIIFIKMGVYEKYYIYFLNKTTYNCIIV